MANSQSVTAGPGAKVDADAFHFCPPNPPPLAMHGAELDVLALGLLGFWGLDDRAAPPSPQGSWSPDS